MEDVMRSRTDSNDGQIFERDRENGDSIPVWVIYFDEIFFSLKMDILMMLFVVNILIIK